jgi:general stress protein 26
MATENNLLFLRERINEIKSAIFYSMSNDLLKIPVSIISIIRIDESGALWFFVKKPSQSMNEYEKSFPAHLQFYRKGKPFYIHVSGSAAIAEEQEFSRELSTLTNESEGTALQNFVLIKLKMIKVEYYEQKSKIPDATISKGFLQNVYSTLFKPSRYHNSIKLSMEIA